MRMSFKRLLSFTSDDQIRSCTHIQKTHWGKISAIFPLSEQFIRDYQNKLDWNSISFNQKMSDKFIIEFQNKINFHVLHGKWKILPRLIALKRLQKSIKVKELDNKIMILEGN